MFEYIYYLDGAKSTGIYKKIQGLISSINKNGSVVIDNNVKPSGLSSKIFFLKSILISKADILIIRSDYNLMPFLFVSLLISRYIYRKKLIVDIPTPLISIPYAKFLSHRSWLKFFLEYIYVVSIAQFFTLPANKVIHNAIAKSKLMWNFKNHHLCGNAIPSVKNLKFSTRDNSRINLIFVGHLGAWHGVDILLKAFNELDHKRFYLYLVGEKTAYESFITDISSDLSRKSIVCTGVLSGNQLAKYYLRSDIALGTMAWDRVGIISASPIKHREYLMYGLPVVCGNSDLDFDPKQHKDIFYSVNGDIHNRHVLIANAIKLLSNSISVETKIKCHKFAINSLSFDSKLHLYLDL